MADSAVQPARNPLTYHYLYRKCKVLSQTAKMAGGEGKETDSV